MGEGEPDSSNGSYIRIKTLHALTIVVLGILALSGFFWTEFKELEKEVARIGRTTFSLRGDKFVKEDEVLKNENDRQNSE